MNKLYFTDKILAKIFIRFIPIFILPNHITVARFILTPVVAVLLWYQYYLAGFIVFLFAALTDAIDGMVARVRDQITEWGKMFDPVADKLLMLTVFIIIAVPRIDLSIIAVIFILESAFVIGAIIYHKRGLKTQANICGKIKMNLEVWAMIVLLAEIMFGFPVLILVSSFLLIMAIFFGFVSLVRQGI